jgi:hypothetical protein
VLQLEQLLLRGLATAAAETGSTDAQQDNVCAVVPAAAESAAATVGVLSCAAGAYAVLLLGEKLLLAPRSWKVMAAGLLAAELLAAEHLQVSMAAAAAVSAAYR